MSYSSSPEHERAVILVVAQVSDIFVDFRGAVGPALDRLRPQLEELAPEDEAPAVRHVGGTPEPGALALPRSHERSERVPRVLFLLGRL